MALRVGEKAPSFSLKDIGGSEIELLGGDGYKLLVFYKVSCPTCQLTLPFINKMFESYRSAVNFYGVSQDSPEDTENFCKKYGLTFPQLIDHPDYKASISYEVQVVPTIYLVDGEGTITFSEEGFVKNSLESLNEELARICGIAVNPLFEDVSVPAFKAG